MLMMDRAISITEVAQRLGVSTKTVRRMIEAHDIAAFKVLGQWRIKESEVQRIMNQSTSDQDRRDK